MSAEVRQGPPRSAKARQGPQGLLGPHRRPHFDIFKNKLSNFLMSNSSRTGHGDPSRVDTIEPQRRNEPRELVAWQFTTVLLKFVHYSLVCVENPQCCASALQSSENPCASLSAYFSHPRATISLSKFSVTRRTSSFQKGFIEVGDAVW